MYHLPAWFQQFSTAAVLIVELVVSMVHLYDAASQAQSRAPRSSSLQVLIALTGNYAFFNLLTFALAMTLLRRCFRPRWAGRPAVSSILGNPSRRPRACPLLLPVIVAVITVPVSLAVVASQVRIDLPGSASLGSLRVALAPFRSVNA